MTFLKGFWRLLKRCQVLGFNPKKNIIGMNPLLISTIFIVATAFLMLVMRCFVKKVVNDGIVKQMLLEFIATAELCAVCFELVIVADNYGVWVYALFLFALTVWWSKVWETESACPYIELEKYVEGSQQAAHALLVILAQILGGMIIYYYVQLLWSMELSETHRGKAYESCKADLQSQTRTLITEILGTFISTFPKRYAKKCCGAYAIPLALLWDITFTLLGKLLGVGPVYMNAAIATCFNWKCRSLKYILVGYLIGSNVGAVCAFVLIRRVHCHGEQVSAAIGTLVEGFLTCACRLASHILGDTQARFSAVADPFFGTMMVVVAFNYSGGYFNPALATSLKLNCEGHSLVEFMCVYWVGACAGAVLSMYVYKWDFIQQFVKRMRPKTE